MKTGTILILCSLGAAPLHAQSEESLRQFFEGRSVVVRIDMPASSSGVDVYPERERPLDMGKHASRIRESGVAVREGERITVTKVKVKDDLIEFQLGEGGFNTFRNGSGSVSVPSVAKSNREKDLEREIKREDDPDRKRRMQRELDDLREDREREEARNRAVAEAANEVRREKDRERALAMGSRFNVRFEKRVPPQALTPDGLMRALANYVDFPGGPRPPERAEDLRYERTDRPADLPELRKGMSREEVESLLGNPEREDVHREAGLRSVVAVYRRGPDVIDVTFVEDVLVRSEVRPR
ncbi:MAG TPA: hypothetical protein VN461_22125 [Vicinamibacteria bacterium]|jgi:hypothetical protein|nr:hypothetical protein [Vicinamibacteria bacterium]